MRRLAFGALLMALGAALALGVSVRAQSGDDGRYVVVGVILYDKMLGQEVYVYNASGYATATPGDPVATATPEPTRTPSATPTMTVAPADPTPTPDSGVTPSPTSDAVKACLAVSSAAINLRADHTTSATVLDNIDPSVRMEVLSFWVVEDVRDEWLQVRAEGRSGQTRTGWVYRGSSVFVGVDDTEELCWDVPADGPGTVPTPAPTATPGPPITPVPTEPAPGDCTYVHPTANMNIRAGGSTGAAIVGVLPAATRAVVGHINPDTPANRWALISYAPPGAPLLTGWVAVTSGSVAFGSLEGNCAGVPRYPVSAAPMVGWTVTPGASRDALIQAGRVLQAAGLRPSATVTSDHETATRLHDEGWYIVVRLWTIFPGDCADVTLSPATSARLRVEYLGGQHAGARFDAAQLTNECAWPSAAYLRDWLIAAVEQCDARGWTCIPTAFNTGSPELTWLPVLRPALRLMRERGHLLGYNAYPYDAERMLCEQSDYTSYFTFRYRRFATVVPAGELPAIYLTEAARGDGARTVVLEDAACFAAAAAGQVVAINYWYYGIPLAPWLAGAWTNAQLLAGAEAIIRALL